VIDFHLILIVILLVLFEIKKERPAAAACLTRQASKSFIDLYPASFASNVSLDKDLQMI